MTLQSPYSFLNVQIMSSIDVLMKFHDLVMILPSNSAEEDLINYCIFILIISVWLGSVMIDYSYATNEMHDIDWEKAEVVDCHPHYHQVCALEAWPIRTEPHRMNRDGGPLPTSTIP